MKISRFIVGLSFFSGVFLIVKSFFHVHRLDYLKEVILSEGFSNNIQLSRVLGVLFILIAWNLYQRKRFAWYILLIIEIISLGQHVFLKDLVASIWFVFLIIVTLLAYNTYSLKNNIDSLYQNIWISFCYIILFWVYAFLGFFLFERHFSDQLNFQIIFLDYVHSITGWGQDLIIPVDRLGRSFENSIPLFSYFVYGFAFLNLSRPFLIKKEVFNESFYQKIYDSTDSLSPFSLLPDKQYIIKKGILYSFCLTDNVAVCLPPVGGKNTKASLKAFAKEFEENGYNTIWYAIREQDKKKFESMAESELIGEEALITLSEFSLDGSKMKNIRNSYTKAQRLGLEVIYHKGRLEDNIFGEQKTIFKEWSKKHKYSFSMNFDPFSPHFRGEVLIVKWDKKAVGLFTFLSYGGGNCLVLDLMIMDKVAPNGFTEAVIVDAINHYKEQGVKEISLGMVASHYQLSFPYNGLVEYFYAGKSLRHFKNKFNPKWVPRYVFFANTISTWQAFYAVVKVHIRAIWNINIL
jgi:phosphatidylglycerol lysyltransferase